MKYTVKTTQRSVQGSKPLFTCVAVAGDTSPKDLDRSEDITSHLVFIQVGSKVYDQKLDVRYHEITGRSMRFSASLNTVNKRNLLRVLELGAIGIICGHITVRGAGGLVPCPRGL